MANLYRALDVHVLTTIGEGAGLPPLRARACGTPSLVRDNTSNTEFCAHQFERVNSFPTHLDNGSNLLRYYVTTLDYTKPLNLSIICDPTAPIRIEYNVTSIYE